MCSVRPLTNVHYLHTEHNSIETPLKWNHTLNVKECQYLHFKLKIDMDFWLRQNLSIFNTSVRKKDRKKTNWLMGCAKKNISTTITTLMMIHMELALRVDFVEKLLKSLTLMWKMCFGKIGNVIGFCSCRAKRLSKSHYN